jgi:DNA-binding MarR family transcriptional regulator
MRSLVLQIHQAARLFDRMLDPVLAELGLAVSDLPILVTAMARDGTTIAQLRDWFGYPGATASVAVRRLEIQEYLRTGRDAPDARVLVVYATRHGRVAAAVALARIGEIEERIGRRAGESAVDGCLQVLDAAQHVQLPRAMQEMALPRDRPRRRPRPGGQPSRRRSRARMADSSAGSA